MIDQDLIEELPDDARHLVQDALMNLVVSGVVELQRKRLLEQLAAGDSTEELSLVAQAVLDYRKKDQALQELEELGQRYMTEDYHA